MHASTRIEVHEINKALGKGSHPVLFFFNVVVKSFVRSGSIAVVQSSEPDVALMHLHPFGPKLMLEHGGMPGQKHQHSIRQQSCPTVLVTSFCLLVFSLGLTACSSLQKRGQRHVWCHQKKATALSWPQSSLNPRARCCQGPKIIQ